MKKDWLTDDEVEKEIEQLRQSDMVKLARKELRLKYKRRQKLYSLRNLEKRGEALANAGITYNMLDELENDEIQEIVEENL